MSTHRNIDRICVAAVVVSLLICMLFMNGEALGLEASEKNLGYEDRLFDSDLVHSIDIELDDWDSFIAGCESEEYSTCSLTVDGEKFSAVGIRGKGNTSLRNVSSMDSERYSFKLEFDRYDSSMSYHGLDKLCLNNIIQDNTYMKDYLAYTLMAGFGVDAPLCSFVYITVNGEDWGLYLAVEGVEDSFLARNYGSEGNLYKPDSMSFGGGRGNGKDFVMNDFMEKFESGGESDNGASTAPQTENMPDFRHGGGPGGDFNGAADMGSASDVKLQYIDDEPESYSNIFSSAKTEVSDADKSRLVESLKKLSEYEELESVIDTDKVLRYFVVHNFLVNGDSYTGSMIHNYYLYENEGQLSMIPWDYNLAFGTFNSGSASSAVNDPIDEVLSDRPMQAWIFSDEAYTEMYHELFSEFIENADIEGIIDKAYSLIAPYVKKDLTSFCTYEEFEAGAATLKSFCKLRSESVLGQLDGSIPSTSETQSADSAALVDAAGLELSAMGSMASGGGGAPGQDRDREEMPQMPEGNMPEKADEEIPVGFGGMPDMGTPPEKPDRDGPGMPGNVAPRAENRPEGNFSGMGGAMPDGMAGMSPQTKLSTEEIILYAACALLLAGGMIFALKYNRRRVNKNTEPQTIMDEPVSEGDKK